MLHQVFQGCPKLCQISYKKLDFLQEGNSDACYKPGIALNGCCTGVSAFLLHLTSKSLCLFCFCSECYWQIAGHPPMHYFVTANHYVLLQNHFISWNNYATASVIQAQSYFLKPYLLLLLAQSPNHAKF